MFNFLNLTSFLRGRLPRRIAIWVFLSIVIIEIIILIPSVIKFERDQLQSLRQIGVTTVSNSLHTSASGIFYSPRRLHQLVVGLNVYDENEELILEFGENPQHDLDAFIREGHGIYAGDSRFKRNRYEVSSTLKVEGKAVAIIARLDSSHILSEVLAYIWRIFLLVMIISLVVCVTTMFILHRLIIGPLFKIRDNLDAVRNNPENANQFKLGKYRKDELGDVHKSIDLLLDRVATTYREELAMFADMAENSQLAALAYDNNKNLIYVNDACVKITGLETEQLLWDHNGPRLKNSSQDNECLLPDIYTDKFFGEVELLRADGTKIPCLLSAGQLFDSENNISRYYATIADLTELKKHEVELANLVKELEIARDKALDASRAKSSLLANMSHELRTPLNAIIGYSQLLTEEAEDANLPEMLPDLNKIEGAGRHLLRLINNILDLSKIEAGKTEVIVDNFDVKTVIDETITLVKPMLEKNLNTFELTLAENIGSMRSDQTKIRQNLVNLLSNAAKFTSNGKIVLDVAKSQNMIIFSISDTGIGMTNPQIEKLFRPFEQADSSTTREFGGTGLGLALTKCYAEMLGGNIDVASEYGEGSKFTLTLPVDCGLQESTFKPLKSVTYNTDGDCVLVIDDDPAFRASVSNDLISSGYQVIEARGGNEGIKLASEHKPNVIILDIIMPDLEGWSVLKALKANSETKDIPVILATMTTPGEMAYALGAADVLAKPVDAKTLFDTLAKHTHSPESSDILVVDDDAATRDFLSRILRKEGWRVSEASNGHEAIAIIKKRRPSIISLDLLMPDMNGFQVLEALRDIDGGQDIPVIVITSKDLDQEETAWLANRANQVFQKGIYDRAEVVSLIRDVIG